MCTVSWLRVGDGYQLFCNRDELRSRGVATPPGLAWAGDVRYLAPRDSDFGGTWVAVNEFGLTLCLLNGIGQGGAQRSRGLLLAGLMALDSAETVGHELQPALLRPYAPFTLMALDATGGGCSGTWDGEVVCVRPVRQRAGLLCSSSFDAEGARLARQALFDQLLPDGGANHDALLRFHESHGDGASAYSPCMHRDDAETVSFTRIAVTPGRIGVSYSPGAPCRHHPSNTIELVLQGARPCCP